MGKSIRLEAADTWFKKLIVEFAKSGGRLVEKKRKECISASPCDAGNRLTCSPAQYDTTASVACRDDAVRLTAPLPADEIIKPYAARRLCRGCLNDMVLAL